MTGRSDPLLAPRFRHILAAFFSPQAMQHLVFPSSASAAVPGKTPPLCEEAEPRLIGALTQLRDLDGGLTARRTVALLQGRSLGPRSWVALMDIVVAFPPEGTQLLPLQPREPRSVRDKRGRSLGDIWNSRVMISGLLPSPYIQPLYNPPPNKLCINRMCGYHSHYVSPHSLLHCTLTLAPLPFAPLVWMTRPKASSQPWAEAGSEP